MNTIGLYQRDIHAWTRQTAELLRQRRFRDIDIEHLIAMTAQTCETDFLDNIAHLLDNPYFELLRHDVTFPLYVEVDEIYNLACPASPIHSLDWEPKIPLREGLKSTIAYFETLGARTMT